MTEHPSLFTSVTASGPFPVFSISDSISLSENFRVAGTHDFPAPEESTVSMGIWEAF